jgi:4-hydroxy 2-oxovalerate aldolase
VTLDILECTLRDASYPVGYQFTAEDTAVIAAGLEEAGFRLIEIGHGLGLGASTEQIGIAAASDEEYLEAAASILKIAKFGVFFIPGIANREHMALAAKYGAGFVRIGTNVNETDQAEEFIKQAKDLGMLVSCNLMKTYAFPVGEVVQRSEMLDRWGADVISVVDSAGGMVPDEVTEYVRLLKENVNARIGFHGHNNLQLAVANTLAALRAGASVLDCTLRGLGRSSGNAQTEVLVTLLMKLGHRLGIDLYKTMDLGERLIGPIAQGRGVDAIEVTSGYAQFHSSFMKVIDKVSRECGVDPRELIIRVSQVDKVNVTEDLALEVAKQIRLEGAHKPASRALYGYNFHVPSRHPEPTNVTEFARKMAKEISTIARKTGRCSIFTIAFTPVDGSAPRFPFVRTNAMYVVGNAEVCSAEQATEVASAVDGIVEFVLMDGEQKDGSHQNAYQSVVDVVQKSQVLSYRDSDAHLDAAEAIVAQLLPGLAGQAVAVCGLSSFGVKLALRLSERGARVLIWDEDDLALQTATELLSRWGAFEGGSINEPVRALRPEDQVRILIGGSVRRPTVTRELIQHLVPNGTLLDGGVGSLTEAAVEEAIRRGMRVFRLDMRAGLSGQIATHLETLDLLRSVVGAGELDGIRVVAGGSVGKRGSVVVDAIRHPTRVIGIADGRGGLLPAIEAEKCYESVARVKQEMLRRRLS